MAIALRFPLGGRLSARGGRIGGAESEPCDCGGRPAAARPSSLHWGRVCPGVLSWRHKGRGRASEDGQVPGPALGPASRPTTAGRIARLTRAGRAIGGLRHGTARPPGRSVGPDERFGSRQRNTIQARRFCGSSGLFGTNGSRAAMPVAVMRAAGTPRRRSSAATASARCRLSASLSPAASCA